MSMQAAHHDSFVIERIYDASPSRVFQAWTDPAAKAKWFNGPEGKWKELKRECDIRVGGSEVVTGEFVERGITSSFHAHYYEIVPDSRVIYAYEMYVNQKRISVSIATIEIFPNAGGTRLVLTEDGVFLDNQDSAEQRRKGTEALMDAVGRSLSS